MKGTEEKLGGSYGRYNKSLLLHKRWPLLWSTEKIESADFEVIELSNYKELSNLIKEKELSKEDLTLILKTICLCDVNSEKN